MGLPLKLFNFTVAVNGRSLLGVTRELTLPKLTLKTDEYQGAGMVGPVSVMHGFTGDALDIEVTLGGLDAVLLKDWGAHLSGTQFRFSGSYDDDVTGEPVGCEIRTRGRFTGLDMGTAKAGDDTAHKYTLKNAYYRLRVAGEDIIEVDFEHMKWVTGGTDRWAKHRGNMGL